MYKIFMRHIPDTMGIFLDDGCVKGRSNNESLSNIPGVRRFVFEHINDVVSVLQTMINAGLTVSGKKCRFGVSEVELVGFICDEHGRRPTGSNISKVIEWPRPKNLTQVRGFLGMCGFYRIWVPNFSSLAEPLYRIKKSTYQQSVLRPPDYQDPNRPLILTVDASPVGAGAVLQQCDKNGNRFVWRDASKSSGINQIKDGRSQRRTRWGRWWTPRKGLDTV
ncbi:Transposon Tf2-9 polyprotein [Smittium culicis]|uniref:Transposon Tf2-9 polyprotein n=1 Tax=Smittium culicis TaxID=133412 RepID=A0A1R1XBG4_9FUNG|nr:Transposon Tf2-9 polyprotein [Smittium culicis]